MNNVIFGSIRSYTDLDLLLTDVEVSSAEPKRTLVDVPGMDGLLELKNGDNVTRFKNRKITLTFARANYQHEWQQIFSRITTALHGRNFNVVIEPDTAHYWKAFCSVSKTKSKQNKGIVVVELDACPYQLNTEPTVYEVRAAYGGNTQICENSRMQVKPEFYASNSGCTLTFGDITKELDTGSNIFADVVFGEGDNEIMVTGTGTVTVTYTEGTL